MFLLSYSHFESITLAIVATIDSLQNFVIAFLSNHKEALVGRKRVWQFLVGRLSNSDNSCIGGEPVVSLHFCELIKWESEFTASSRWKRSILF